MRQHWPSLTVFLILTVGGGLMIGYLTPPGDWYQSLQKPSFNPPAWIFGPVWTTLYVLIAIAGWIDWNAERDDGLLVWIAQLALYFAWSPLFFGLQSIGAALMVIGLLLVAILAYLLIGWSRQRRRALLFLPYLAWVGYATLLNASMYLLN